MNKGANTLLGIYFLCFLSFLSYGREGKVEFSSATHYVGVDFCINGPSQPESCTPYTLGQRIPAPDSKNWHIWYRLRYPEISSEMLAPVVFFEHVRANFRVHWKGQIIYEHGSFPGHGEQAEFPLIRWHMLPVDPSMSRGVLWIEAISDREPALTGLPRIVSYRYLVESIISESFHKQIINIFLILMGLLSLFFFLLQRERVYLAFSYLSLTIGIYMIASQQNHLRLLIYDSAALWTYLNLICLLNFGPSLGLFLQNIVKLKPSITLKWVIRFQLLWMVCCFPLFIGNYMSFAAMISPYHVSLLVTLISGFRRFWFVVMSRQKMSRFFLICLCITSAIGFRDLISAMGFLSDNFFMLQYGMAILLLGSLVIMFQNYDATQKALRTSIEDKLQTNEQMQRRTNTNLRLSSYFVKTHSITQAVDYFLSLIRREIPALRLVDLRLFLVHVDDHGLLESDQARQSLRYESYCWNRTEHKFDLSQDDRVLTLEAKETDLKRYRVFALGSQERPIGRFEVSGDHSSLELIDSNQSYLQSLLATATLGFEETFSALEREKQAKLESDLEAARVVQQILLSKHETIQGLHYQTYYKAAEQTGGDWYHVHTCKNSGKTVFVMIDVTGHGIASAMVTAMVGGIIMSYLEGVSQRSHGSSASPNLNEMTQNLNHMLFSIGGKTNLAMTMAALVIDSATGDLEYLNAGHCFLVLQRDSEIRSIPHPGSMIGMQPNASFSVKHLNLNPGDRLLLYTDGLLENKGPKGERIRYSQIRKIMNEAKTIESLRERLVKQIDETWLKERVEDDCTFMVIELEEARVNRMSS
ncbi:MAG: SpoIIE family protein phosphatase [Pseudobacteriovorax sp.]|nr:SpoIIE family protein phosphatase [Pseudobacteriovorax sp.]